MLDKDALENGLERKVDRVYIYSTGLGKEIRIQLIVYTRLTLTRKYSTILKEGLYYTYKAFRNFRRAKQCPLIMEIDTNEKD